MPNFTKTAIQNSFLKLLNQTTLDKITVKDIVEDCGINRNTFYYHYQDIYALLDDVFKAETMRVVDNPNMESWQDAVIGATKFALENKKMIYHVYNSINRERIEIYLNSVTETLMFHYLKQEAKRSSITINDEKLKFLASFFKYGLVGMVFEWLRNGMTAEPETMIQKLGPVIEISVRSIIEQVDKHDLDI